LDKEIKGEKVDSTKKREELKKERESCIEKWER
jgi:hypothetical protein